MTADLAPAEADYETDRAAERVALGSALWSAEVTTELARLVGPDDWVSPRHTAIFAACLALAERGEPVEPTSVLLEIEQRGELQRVGGAPYLHDLAAAASPGWGHFAGQVALRSVLRGVGRSGQRLQQLAVLGMRGADVDEVIDRARAELDELAQRRSPREVPSFQQLLADTVRWLAEPAPPGLATPWPDLDEMLGGGGLQAGALVVLGARPGVGKSALAANLARFVAGGGFGVLVASLEMTQAELMTRIISAEAGVDFGRLRDHRLTAEDWHKVDRVAETMRGHRLWIDDTPTQTLSSVRAAAREYARDGLDLVVIDYLQLLKAPDTANRKISRQEEVAGFARGCKLLARELGVPVVALSGINRAPTHRTNARPTLADLRESGEIENSADVVLLLHQHPDRGGELDVIVAKNRNGRTGTLSLQWSPHYQRASSLYRGA